MADGSWGPPRRRGWYRLRLDRQPGGMPEGPVRVYAVAWRVHRGEVERHWATLLLRRPRAGAEPELEVHAQALGSPHLVLEAVSAARAAGAGLAAMLRRACYGERAFEQLEW